MTARTFPDDKHHSKGPFGYAGSSLEEIERFLVDWDDGSVKEAHFGEVSWDGLRNVLRHLVGQYQVEYVQDHEGRDIREEILGDPIFDPGPEGRSISALFLSPAEVIPRILLFASGYGSPWLSIVFYQETLDFARHSLEEFFRFLDALRGASGARTYWVGPEGMDLDGEIGCFAFDARDVAKLTDRRYGAV